MNFQGLFLDKGDLLRDFVPEPDAAKNEFGACHFGALCKLQLRSLAVSWPHDRTIRWAGGLKSTRRILA